MTVPLALDLTTLPAALAGAGQSLLKRLRLLDSEGVPNLTVFSHKPDLALEEAAGARLTRRLPDDAEIASFRVLFVAGLQDDLAFDLAARARAHRVLVNVEDNLPLCDFHVPAILRRGDLALSISTGGASPTLSRRLRAHLEELFPEDWSQRIQRIAAMRRQLRAEGASMSTVMQATDALIDGEGWLKPR